jgi:hypothetical protein
MEKSEMNKDFNVIGYLYEYHPDTETKDPIYVEDLNTNDPERLILLKEWASGLANPWSGSAMSYMINCDDRREIDDAHRWKATFSSIFYDFLESAAVCYAETPEGALHKVQELVKDVIEKFAAKDGKDE